MNVKLVALTRPQVPSPDKTNGDVFLSPEEFIVYCARVSNPSNQLNTETAPRLLAYCIKHKHWSIFETVSMTVEIQTSRAIAAQILRHRSFSFQEFSQRYAQVINGCEDIELRRKADKNRQGSGDVLNDASLNAIVKNVVHVAEAGYENLCSAGVAPEVARMILPLATKTTLYMTGSVRSWIHYLEQRTSPHAQKEHRAVALRIQDIFCENFPSTAEALVPEVK